METGAIQSESVPTPGRRVLAVVLPELLCELAERQFTPSVPLSAKEDRQKRDRTGRSPKRRSAARPLAVLLVEHRTAGAEPGGNRIREKQQLALDFAPAEHREPEWEPTAIIGAVNHAARHYGVCPQQTVAEACALVAKLSIRTVTKSELESALGKVAEVAFGFGATVSVRSPDTVLVDVTGAAHLFGGEEALGLELARRVRAMGHVVQVAIADGPILARSFARYGIFVGEPDAVLVISADAVRARLAELPLKALPFAPEEESWLVRLGVITVGDFMKLPRAATAGRLGESARRVFSLTEGKDVSPLVAYEPNQCVEESVSWDEPVHGIEPLLFVARGLASRVGSRLEGRGKAAQVLELAVEYDAAIARHRQVAHSLRIKLELSTPLVRSEDLVRVIGVKLRNLQLDAPSVGMTLSVVHMTAAPQLQLNLARAGGQIGGRPESGPEELGVLLAELSVDVGERNVGVLALQNSHRPEKKSELVSANLGPLGAKRKPRTSRRGGSRPHGKRRSRSQLEFESVADQVTLAVESNEPTLIPRIARDEKEPTRLLKKPLALHTSLKVGSALTLGHELYTIENVEFVQRLESVEWWSDEETSRDYLRVWLRGRELGFAALAYIDRRSGKRFLQAFYD